jgi:itaconate CoA-transferase
VTTAPLAGVTVVAMEQAVAAPMCTRVLADFGARIIKVENPTGGDFARDYDDVVNGPGGLAAHFVWCNRGKESVTLNLKSPAGMEVLHRLLDGAGFRQPRKRYGGERLVDLEHTNLVDADARLVEQLLGGRNRAGQHQHRVRSGDGAGAVPGDRGEPQRERIVFGHHQ